MSAAWRAINDKEKRIINALLSRDFLGNGALRAQLETAEVLVIDTDGSLHFRVTGSPAIVERRVPVEAFYYDLETHTRPAVNLLLHVVSGMLHELEVYKDDGSPIITSLDDVELANLQFPI